MKRLHAIFAAAIPLLAACATSNPNHPNNDPLAAQQRFVEAQRAAQASALRPGDEDLSCTQLELEMLAISNDPAYTAAMVANAANAESITSATNSAAASVQGMSALGLASALPLPGMEVLSVANAHAQRATLSAHQAQTSALMASTMDNLADMQPVTFRMLRVAELATTKDCAFLTGGAS